MKDFELLTFVQSLFQCGQWRKPYQPGLQPTFRPTEQASTQTRSLRRPSFRSSGQIWPLLGLHTKPARTSKQPLLHHTVPELAWPPTKQQQPPVCFNKLLTRRATSVESLKSFKDCNFNFPCSKGTIGFSLLLISSDSSRFRSPTN